MQILLMILQHLLYLKLVLVIQLIYRVIRLSPLLITTNEVVQFFLLEILLMDLTKRIRRVVSHYLILKHLLHVLSVFYLLLQFCIALYQGLLKLFLLYNRSFNSLFLLSYVTYLLLNKNYICSEGSLLFLQKLQFSICSLCQMIMNTLILLQYIILHEIFLQPPLFLQCQLLQLLQLSLQLLLRLFQFPPLFFSLPHFLLKESLLIFNEILSTLISIQLFLPPRQFRLYLIITMDQLPFPLPQRHLLPHFLLRNQLPILHILNLLSLLQIHNISHHKLIIPLKPTILLPQLPSNLLNIILELPLYFLPLHPTLLDHIIPSLQQLIILRIENQQFLISLILQLHLLLRTHLHHLDQLRSQHLFLLLLLLYFKQRLLHTLQFSPLIPIRHILQQLLSLHLTLLLHLLQLIKHRLPLLHQYLQPLLQTVYMRFRGRLNEVICRKRMRMHRRTYTQQCHTPIHHTNKQHPITHLNVLNRLKMHPKHLV